MNIAIFGGSFDPPHNGHNEIIKKVLNTLDIDRLFIVPTFINPFKNSFFAPPNLRLEWIKTLWANLEKVEIFDYEIRQNRAVATIETVLQIHKTYEISNLFLIIGADNLENLEKWHRFDELKKLVKFVVATRDAIKVPLNLQKINLNVNISSTKIRNGNFTGIPNLIKNDVIQFYKRKKMNNRVENIAKILEDKKSENVEVIDMSGGEYIAKFVVIATTLTGRHALSLVDDLKKSLKGEEFLSIENSDDWTVIDLGDIIIHLMSQSYRDRYNIEDFLSKLKKIY
ncbi:fused nicotinate-mononucleotide adenylyltransferase / ribosomal silencing factor [Campylobacter blaseri]|uniref:Multifunctional fusion protein n=1 Tax=Campylobacter blaseri TaxID=2042961 RepID=A0A2P8R1F5_9BACT|nr:nicotinate (nicotinamide) nucleotide adenylyltransferase [Campylobacter blaseri]PSM52324.1 ribosome silencing factor RsfS [Campylobacter blaseri]PSM54090.1 ribosome silencing factor RsfS [Campylobacter blaseri]QKF85532.1 fused nicotinate-mononucleotide adenylyltransferase / ribosomal silencing factor [Campylobacter blaseri]